MKKYLIFLLIIGLLFPMATAFSADNGNSGFPFLGIDADNRSAALGGTQLNAANSAMAAFTNPAVLANTNGFNVATGLANWIADIRHYSGAITYNIGSKGTFGLTGIWMDYGSFTERYSSESNGGSFVNSGYVEGRTFSVAEYAIGLAYARPVTKNWQMGVHVKYAGQNLPSALNSTSTVNDETTDRSRSGLLLDVGTVYYPGLADLRFGASIQNLRNGLNSNQYGLSQLPATLSVGGAVDLFKLIGLSETNQMTFSFDWQQEQDYQSAQHLGMEYGLLNSVFLRGGYRFNDNVERLTAGFGINTEINNVNMVLDYAYSSFGEVFGAVHRFSIGFGL